MLCSRQWAALLAAFVCSLFLLSPPQQSQAQDMDTRFGLGFNSLISTGDGLGIGLRGRVSTPVNRDVSVAFDLGFSGFVLGGREDASYVFDPQLSAIVTLPESDNTAPYVLAGVGAYVPFGPNLSDDPLRGPTVHLGLGWVRALSETSLFYEVNPALVIAQERVGLSVPVRIGLIF